jgi:hypothetical protein
MKLIAMLDCLGGQSGEQFILSRRGAMETPFAQPSSSKTDMASAKQPALDGALLSPRTLFLIGCGVFGGVLFTVTYLIEGVTRPSYDAVQYAMSVLSLGPGGWVQQVNFVIFGILAIVSAFGWRMALTPGVGRFWYPFLKVSTGTGLIIDGFFSQDPVAGYPVGAVVGPATTHAVVHTLSAFVSITAIAIGSFVLARRFAVEPRWRGWTLYAVLTGLLTIGLIAAFGAANSHPGAPAGLLERLATGVNTVLSLAIFGRLLLDRRRISGQ